MAKPIEGRVSTVVSTREIAINIGAKDGVNEGMVFAVMAKSPVKITDPDNDRVLGQLDREKIRVKVTEVKEGFAIARTFQKYQTAGGALASAATFGALFNMPRTRYQTLRVEDSELPPPLPEDESFVKRGDRVRQIAEPSLDEDEEEE